MLHMKHILARHRRRGKQRKRVSRGEGYCHIGGKEGGWQRGKKDVKESGVGSVLCVLGSSEANTSSSGLAERWALGFLAIPIGMLSSGAMSIGST
jgi:hypothetical protein